MRPHLLLFLLAGLCACSGSQWTKSGASPETAKADLRECQDEARSLLRQDENIDADIMASRSQDWERTGTLGLKRQTFAAQNRGRSEDIIGQCMRGKGYSSAEAP